MKILSILAVLAAVAGSAFSQSNQVQLCDQTPAPSCYVIQALPGNVGLTAGAAAFAAGSFSSQLYFAANASSVIGTGATPFSEIYTTGISSGTASGATLTISSNNLMLQPASTSANLEIVWGQGPFGLAPQTEIDTFAQNSITLQYFAHGGGTAKTIIPSTAEFQFWVTPLLNPVKALDILGSGANTITVTAYGTLNFTGSLQTNGTPGVTSPTCTQWTNGICTRP